jgi:hypothetical protein
MITPGTFPKGDWRSTEQRAVNTHTTSPLTSARTAQEKRNLYSKSVHKFADDEKLFPRQYDTKSVSFNEILGARAYQVLI